MDQWFGGASSAPLIQSRFDSLDRRGEAVTYFMVLLWCCVAAGPRSLVELGTIPLAATLLIRAVFVLWNDRASGLAALRAAFFHWTSFLALLWALWMMLTLTWSVAPDSKQGWQEIANGRWAGLLIPSLALCSPRILRAGLSTLACAITVAAAVVLLEWAVFHTIAPDSRFAALRSAFLWSHPPEPNGVVTRLSGWWNQPAVGGAMLVAGIGFLLPALVHPSTTRFARAGTLLGLALSLFALLLTGARGAWISCVATFALFTLATALHAWSRAATPAARQRMKATLFALAVGGLVIVGALTAIAPVRTLVTERIREGIREVADFQTGRDVNSFTGTRLAMAGWAVAAVKERPFTGVGAGAFEPFVRQHLASQGIDPASRRVMSQAHNTALHALATTGLTGLGLLIATVATAVIRSSRAESSLRATHRNWPAFSPAWGLIALSLHSVFDTIYVNQSTAALACTFVALSIALSAKADDPLRFAESP